MSCRSAFRASTCCNLPERQLKASCNAPPSTDRTSAQGRTRRLPPWHGSSPAPNLCGGAQRGISLATGFFTGESRRKPLGARSGKKRLVIKGLRNHDLGVLDSFAEARESSLRKPLGGSHRAGSHSCNVTLRSAKVTRPAGAAPKSGRSGPTGIVAQ